MVRRGLSVGGHAVVMRWSCGGQSSNGTVFVECGPDDVVPVVAEDLTGRGQNLRVDCSTESGDVVAVAEEGCDIWVAEQGVSGTFAAGAGDETS